jgi:hypothetical protein
MLSDTVHLFSRSGCHILNNLITGVFSYLHRTLGNQAPEVTF